MKKLFYSLVIAFTLALSFTACTEEGVAPKTNEGNNGGGVSTDPKSK